MSANERHIEEARALMPKIGCIECVCIETSINPCVEIIARALATAERRGMERAAEIALARSRKHASDKSNYAECEVSQTACLEAALEASECAGAILEASKD